jgi:hypothetical protein
MTRLHLESLNTDDLKAMSRSRYLDGATRASAAMVLFGRAYRSAFSPSKTGETP